MTEILTQQQLEDQLNNLRNTINHFDYSDLQNVTFINLESLYTYIAEVENNPFQRQYDTLQSLLDTLEPYLPFATGERAKEFLLDASQATSNDELEYLKQSYTFNMRLDFVNQIRCIRSEDEWKYVLGICETIRQSRENAMRS